MSEKTAWLTVRKHLVSGGGVHVQRFEDKLTGGIPDTNICMGGVEAWLEGKFVRDLPKRETTLVRVGLRPDQCLWLETRQRVGGLVFVWIRIRDVGWMLFDSRFRALRDGIAFVDFLNEPLYPDAKKMVQRIVEVMEKHHYEY